MKGASVGSRITTGHKLAILLLLVVAFFLWPKSGSGAAPNCPTVGKRYGLMLDAGSTGSRIHVFEFDYAASGAVKLLNEVFEEVKPGLSSYGADAKGAAASLKPLMDAAVKSVPASMAPCSPVELKATAGLRLLGEAKSSAILKAVIDLFKTYDFAVAGPEAAIVMAGKDEGPYAWMTVNFLLDRLSTKAEEKTAAIIDMGGASTQVVFLPDDAAAALKEATPDQLYTVDIEGYNAKVYTHSHLGYGLKEAGKAIVRAGAPSNAFPCFPKTYTDRMTSAGNVVSNEEGEQSFDKCLPFAEKILKKDAACTSSACSFNGVFQPSLSKAFTGPLYIFSYYYDRMQPFLAASGESTVGELRSMGQKVCNSDNEHNKGTYCMDLAYLYALLKTGYDLDDTTKLYVKKKINGIETAWALGAMIVAMKPK